MLTWYTIATIVVGIDIALVASFVFACKKFKQENLKLTWKLEELPTEEVGEDALRLVSND